MRPDYVDVRRGRLHVRRTGDGPEVVLLLHQTASSGAMWEDFAAELGALPSGGRYRLLAPDTPGFGASFVPADPYRLTDWAQDMADLIRAEGVDAVHVVGHHTGAAIGCALAADHPGLVRTLAMVGAVALPAADRDQWRAGVVGMRPDLEGTHLATAWAQVGAIDGAASDHLPDVDLRHREVVDKLHAGRRWHEAYLAVFGTDVADLLARTRCPALLVCGRSDVLHPYVPHTRLARPDVAYVELDAGGYVCDQQPGAVVAAWQGFLDTQVIAGLPGPTRGVDR